jgi:hypothetical protein
MRTDVVAVALADEHRGEELLVVDVRPLKEPLSACRKLPHMVACHPLSSMSRSSAIVAMAASVCQ